MFQEVFHIGSLSISPFGPLMVAAFASAFFLLRSNLRFLGVGDDDDAIAILYAAAFGGIFGGKIYYAILYQDIRLLYNRAGLVWYGGFLLASAAVVWTLRRRRLPKWQTMDAATPAMALGYAVGRIGCFLVGDDYGVPTDVPWGVKFPVGLPPTEAGRLRSEFGIDVPASIPADELLAVHPTQLYETMLALLICSLGLVLLRRGARVGTVTVVTLGLLACERFGIEFLRAKDDRMLGSFTVAQAISALVVVTMLVLWQMRPDPREA